MTPTDRTPDVRPCAGDVAAYALGALDSAEADAFRAHLETCATCRDELVAFRAVVDALPVSAPQHAAPKRLRRRVVAEVRNDARLQRRAEPGRPRTPISDWLTVRRPAVALVAAVLVIAIAVAGIEIGNSGSSSPSTRVFAAKVIGLRGTAKVTLTGVHAQLVVRDFSPPPAGKIYEIWMQRGSARPAPTGALFSVTASGDSDVDVPGSMRGVTALLVTPEPTGGTPVPTHAPVIEAQLS